MKVPVFPKITLKKPVSSFNELKSVTAGIPAEVLLNSAVPQTVICTIWIIYCEIKKPTPSTMKKTGDTIHSL